MILLLDGVNFFGVSRGGDCVGINETISGGSATFSTSSI